MAKKRHRIAQVAHDEPINDSLEFVGLNPRGSINYVGIVRAVDRVPSTYEGAGEHDTSIELVFEDRRTYRPTAAQRRQIQQTLGASKWGALVGRLLTIRSCGHGVARSVTIGQEPPAWLNLVPDPWKGAIAGPERLDQIPEPVELGRGRDPDTFFIDSQSGNFEGTCGSLDLRGI